MHTSGGIFKDSTIHDLDMVSWIAGSKPVSVYAQGHAHNPTLKEFGDKDQVVVVITYENGTVAVVDNGRWCPFGYDQRLEVTMLVLILRQCVSSTSSAVKKCGC